MSMDMEKVILKFRKNEKGTHTIAFCDEYPELQGIGDSEQNATANFWRAFNKATEKEDHEISMKKREEKEMKAKQDEAKTKGTKKKAA